MDERDFIAMNKDIPVQKNYMVFREVEECGGLVQISNKITSLEAARLFVDKCTHKEELYIYLLVE